MFMTQSLFKISRFFLVILSLILILLLIYEKEYLRVVMFSFDVVLLYLYMAKYEKKIGFITPGYIFVVVIVLECKGNSFLLFLLLLRVPILLIKV